MDDNAPSRKLPTALRLEAHAVAVELLCQMQTDHTIKKALKKQYGVSHSTATSILRKAAASIQEQSAENAQRKKAKRLRQLESLYRTSMKNKRLNVCAQVLKQMTELEGLNAPIELADVSPRKFGEGRSVAELKYYADNGYWPEEQPKGAEDSNTPVSSDPLAALPPVVH